MNEPLIATIGLVAHWLLLLGLSFRIIMRRRPVGSSLAWITLMVLVPLGGAALYLLIGENRLGLGRAARTHELQKPVRRWLRTLVAEETVDWSDRHPAARTLAEHATRLLGLPALDGNRIELIGDSEETLQRIIRDIDAATTAVHLEFYIWALGGTADDVVEAVIRAADRGVKCRVLVDASGSREFLGSRLAESLRESGVAVEASLKVGFFRVLFQRLDVRNHRKIVVIDGRIGYTGSLNLADARFFKREANVGHWVDAMVRLEGPAVEILNGTFIADWHQESVEPLETLLETAGVHSVDDVGPSTVQVVPSGPATTPYAIHEMLLTTIYSARRELIMTTPYFVPDEATLTALQSTAHRGVDVTLVLPHKVDSLLVRYASRAHFQELLDAGVRIVEYQAGLLHSKTITVDQSIALIGSVNLDMRSFWLNFEITLFLYDSSCANNVREMQQGYIADSNAIDPDEFRGRSLPQRTVENVLRLMSPLL